MIVRKVLYVDGIHPAVAKVDFDRLKWKLCESAERSMSVENANMAELEYRRFLTLKRLYPSVELVPNKLVDAFWHAHILDTKAYQRDCDNVFGYFMHHFPYFGIYGEDDQKQLGTAFEETKNLYALHFGDYPGDLDNASRCIEHACHVPSACACRVKGTCK